MKKAFKSLVALCMVFSLLLPDVSVLAANLLTEKKTEYKAGRNSNNIII